MSSKEGSRAEVFHGNKERTSGGLKKGDLIKNASGKIVSKKARAAAKKSQNLGKFQKKKGDKFELSPKTGTNAHKELSGRKSRKSGKKKSGRKSRK